LTHAAALIVMGDDDIATIRQMAGLATPMTLRVAVTLGLPDRLRGVAGTGPAVDELAAELEVSAIALELLLRHLTTLGMVECTGPGRYRTTDFGANLCADADNGLIHSLLHSDRAGGRAELAFVELAYSITTGEAAYPRRYGQDFWADLAAHPHLRESFDQQMVQRFRDQIPGIVAGFDWDRFATIVDVGGGRGALLAAILDARPTLRGHLVDLEPTAAGADRALRAAGLADRVQVSGSSFFGPLPAGAHAYLLCDILHNWDDEHAHRILRRCVEAAHPTSSILVIEAVGGRRAHSEFDLAMLAIFGGRDRTVEEFRALGGAHGLVLTTVTDLTEQRCLLEFRLTSTAPSTPANRSGQAGRS
jgi:hypothetical protein